MELKLQARLTILPHMCSEYACMFGHYTWINFEILIPRFRKVVALKYMLRIWWLCKVLALCVMCNAMDHKKFFVHFFWTSLFENITSLSKHFVQSTVMQPSPTRMHWSISCRHCMQHIQYCRIHAMCQFKLYVHSHRKIVAAGTKSSSLKSQPCRLQCIYWSYSASYPFCWSPLTNSIFDPQRMILVLESHATFCHMFCRMEVNISPPIP